MIMLATTTGTAVNYCQLFGGPASPYISGWLPLTYVVIGLAFAIVAILYMASKLAPTSTSSKLREITKVEITQIVLSIFIVLILLYVTTTACSISSSLGVQVLGNAGVSTNSGINPFQYADYYIGTLALNHGINLLGYVYTTSIGYAIEARVVTALSKDLSRETSTGGQISFSVSYDHDLGTLYGALSDVYFDALSPILVITIGMLYLQYLALPLLEFTAFTVILPVALLIRLIPYGGVGLKTASNAILAIAIAAYIVYPLMIAFDSYIVYWIYSPSLNPAYGCTNCLNTAYTLPSIPSSSFLSSSVTKSSNHALGDVSGALGISAPATNNLLSSSFFSSLTLNPEPAAAYITQQMSQFIFVAVFLFGLNLAVTLGFAMGLARGLNTGVEGSVSFWGSL
ncbi:MAG: hypothetical protein M1465_01210 [Candidatus Marsarchaeota archaeon]|jgi:hypothetical protein|nr:hypothetical protein [Candidatus Marsarchaeota archaeon]